MFCIFIHLCIQYDFSDVKMYSMCYIVLWYTCPAEGVKEESHDVAADQQQVPAQAKSLKCDE